MNKNEELPISPNHSLIDELFNDDYFKDKLNKYLSENIIIRRDYDAYVGKYDDPQISIGDYQIEIKSRSYGY